MLYDDLLEAHLPGKHFVDPAAVSGLNKLADTIKDAPKYVFSERAVQALATVAEKRPTAIEKALPICFLPHPKIWVEFPYSWIKEAMVRVRGAENIRHLQDAIDPTSIGYLFEDLGDGKIRVVLAWVHKNTNFKDLGIYCHSAIHSCLACYLIDTKSAIEITPEDIDRERLISEKLSGDYSRYFRTSEAETESFARLQKRVDSPISPYMQDYYITLYLEREKQPGGLQQLATEVTHDIAGEWRNALAILMILNSKSMITYTEVDRSKLNKSRRKKGLPDTHNYHTADIYLSRVQNFRMGGGSGVRREDLMKHLVSAHLKVRKTGVFLWGAHVRGYKGDDPVVPIRKVK